jgi:hypothetical protein
MNTKRLPPGRSVAALLGGCGDDDGHGGGSSSSGGGGGRAASTRWTSRGGSRITGVMHKLKTLLPLAIVAAVVLSSAALAAPPGGYKGKVEYQGYEVTFNVSKTGKRVTDLVARMLVDCGRDGYTENFLIAPQGSWPIKNGKVSGKRTDRFDQSKATVELKGSFKGGTFKGFVREVDLVEGSGIVCDSSSGSSPRSGADEAAALLPLDRPGWLRRDVERHPVHLRDLVDHA